MKLIELINEVDTNRPNRFSYEQKVRWLSELDTNIFKNIISKRENAEITDFSGYDEKTGKQTELIVKAPYERIYKFYLEAQMEYENQEIARFNNAMAMYNQMYTEFVNDYCRNHKYISTQQLIY